MPTFLDLCKMFLMTYGFISSMKWFCYGVVKLVKYKQSLERKKFYEGSVKKSKPQVKDPVTEFYETINTSNHE